jgi:hypothetical protein
MLCLRAGYNHGSLGQEHNSRDGVGGLRSRERARSVPDQPVNTGNPRSVADSPIDRLTCVLAAC